MSRIRVLSSWVSGLAMLLACMSAAPLASAAIPNLVSRDYLTLGDGLLTFDVTTGLEWLDVSYTVGNTLASGEALPFFDAAGAHGGLRWATRGEVRHLIDSIPPLNSNLGLFEMLAQRVADAEEWVQLVGVTYSPAEFGFTGAEGLSREFTFVDISSGTVSYETAAVLAFRPFDVVGLDGMLCCVDPLITEPNSINRGLWLVRDTAPVPLPASLWMLGGALGGLFASRRVKKSFEGHKRRD